MALRGVGHIQLPFVEFGSGEKRFPSSAPDQASPIQRDIISENLYLQSSGTSETLSVQETPVSHFMLLG